MMLAGGLPSVFVTFAAVAAIAAVINRPVCDRDQGRVLEEASP